MAIGFPGVPDFGHCSFQIPDVCHIFAPRSRKLAIFVDVDRLNNFERSRNESHIKWAGGLEPHGRELGQIFSRESPILSPARVKLLSAGRKGKIEGKYKGKRLNRVYPGRTTTYQGTLCIQTLSWFGQGIPCCVILCPKLYPAAPDLYPDQTGNRRK